MATHTYTGSCQCGRVRYQAKIDLSARRARTNHACDCPTALIKPSAFRLLSGEQDLWSDQFCTLIGHNQPCRHCGIRTFGKGHLMKLGGNFYAINLATLDRV